VEASKGTNGRGLLFVCLFVYGVRREVCVRVIVIVRVPVDMPCDIPPLYVSCKLYIRMRKGNLYEAELERGKEGRGREDGI
jgi:hypothetical protein